MLAIEHLISLQTEKEKTGFVAILKQRNKRHDTRNITMYTDFLNGDGQRLLTEISPNAYHALKKRLADQLIDYMATRILATELTEENQVIKLIALARRLLQAEHIHTGLTLLKRAEKIAVRLGHHAILNEIYHSMITYAHFSDKIDLPELLAKLERNNEQFLTQERLLVLYASMQHQFKSSELQQVPASLHSMYAKGLKTFGIESEMALTFKNLNQLVILTDLYAAQQKNYNAVDLFFEDDLHALQGGKKDNERSLEDHIELLYGLANIYFRKYDLTKSAEYVAQMAAQMARYQNKYATVWQGRLMNLKALILNFSGQWVEALDCITSSLTDRSLSEKERALLHLNLVVIHFQQEQWTDCKKTFRLLRKTDAWYLKNMGNEWLFNYKAIEVLLHFELENFQLAESLILSFKRKYAIPFKHKKDNPIWPFLLLIQSVIKDPRQLDSAKFEERIESTIPWNTHQEDFFNLCFYAWLKAKMQKAPTYEVTLELLRRKQS